MKQYKYPTLMSSKESYWFDTMETCYPFKIVGLSDTDTSGLVLYLLFDTKLLFFRVRCTTS